MLMFANLIDLFFKTEVFETRKQKWIREKRSARALWKLMSRPDWNMKLLKVQFRSNLLKTLLPLQKMFCNSQDFSISLLQTFPSKNRGGNTCSQIEIESSCSEKGKSIGISPDIWDGFHSWVYRIINLFEIKRKWDNFSLHSCKLKLGELFIVSNKHLELKEIWLRKIGNDLFQFVA